MLLHRQMSHGKMLKQFMGCTGEIKQSILISRGLLAAGSYRLADLKRHPPPQSGSSRAELPAAVRWHLPLSGSASTSCFCAACRGTCDSFILMVLSCFTFRLALILTDLIL